MLRSRPQHQGVSGESTPLARQAGANTRCQWGKAPARRLWERRPHATNLSLLLRLVLQTPSGSSLRPSTESVLGPPDPWAHFSPSLMKQNLVKTFSLHNAYSRFSSDTMKISAFLGLVGLSETGETVASSQKGTRWDVRSMAGEFLAFPLATAVLRETPQGPLMPV